LINHGNLTLTNSTFAFNTSLDGGGLQAFDGTVDMRHVTVAYNTATRDGGGIAVNFATVTATNTIIAGNTAANQNDVWGSLAPASSFNLLDQSAAAAGLGTFGSHGGVTETVPLLPGSPAINAGDPGFVFNSLEFDQRGAPYVRVFQGRTDVGSYEYQPEPTACDFNMDTSCDISDIDLLVAQIAMATHNPGFDLSGDMQVDVTDRDLWLALAGVLNLPSGNPYLLGDANLDGTVDGLDFIAWNAHKFTNTAAWSAGDFTADGLVDGLDFIEWNRNKFTIAALGSPAKVPALEASTAPSVSPAGLVSVLPARPELPPVPLRHDLALKALYGPRRVIMAAGPVAARPWKSSLAPWPSMRTA
jgi:hypothetical protein